jgi:hypothetical protein
MAMLHQGCFARGRLRGQPVPYSRLASSSRDVVYKAKHAKLHTSSSLHASEVLRPAATVVAAAAATAGTTAVPLKAALRRQQRHAWKQQTVCSNRDVTAKAAKGATGSLAAAVSKPSWHVMRVAWLAASCNCCLSAP